MRFFSKTAVVGLIGLFMMAPNLLLAGGGPNVSGAKLYIKQNDMKQALKVLTKEIEEVDPENEDAWYLLGYIYARQKKYDKMVEAFDKAIELKPEFREEGIDINGDPGTLFLSEDGAARIKRVVWGNAFNNAVKAFNNGVNATTDSARVAGFETAVDRFRTAAAIMPDSSLAYRNMAAAYMNLQEYEKSVEPLKEALKYSPDDVDVKTMLAQVYMASGQDSLAKPILEELWTGGARDPMVADFLSRLYLKHEQQDEAKEIYKEALKNDPENFEFRYNYGTILLEAGEFDEAIKQFHIAAGSPMGLSAVEPGMSDSEVKQLIGEPLSINVTETNDQRDEQWVYGLGAYVYFSDGVVDAVQYEQKQQSDNPDLYYNLGAAYLNRGVATRDSLPEDSEDTSFREDFEKALPYLEAAVVSNPDETKVWYTLGRIAGQLNKVALSGYAFAKGESERSALDKKVVVGMDSTTLKLVLGEPTAVRPVESDNFPVEEWVYKKREKATDGKIAIPEPLNIYVKGDRVEAILTVK